MLSSSSPRSNHRAQAVAMAMARPKTSCLELFVTILLVVSFSSNLVHAQKVSVAESSSSSKTAGGESSALSPSRGRRVDGDCCNSRKTSGGCNDLECEQLICASDAFCCNKWWDWLCASDANELCQVCQETSDAGLDNQPTPRPFNNDKLPPLPTPTSQVVIQQPQPQPIQVVPIPSPAPQLPPSPQPTAVSETDSAAVAASKSRRIVAPQCDPSSPSYAPKTDTTNDCFQTIELCGRDGTTDPSFYQYTDYMMTDCFDSCVNYLDSISYDNGVEKFCTLMDLPPLESQVPDPSFCNVVDSAWNGRQDLSDHEQQMLLILNNSFRNIGITCPDGTSYDKVSNAVINPQLQCAARMQALKIVKYLNKYKPGGKFTGFPQGMPSLHSVCIGDGSDSCDEFWQRIDKSGYQRVGSAYENAGVGYVTPGKMMGGWKGSSSGHCPVLMAQEYTAVQTEVGLAYYEDLQTGWSAHIMLVGTQ
mmetsp:Transcript_4262/g.10661  ORF Transcript_4262/g.10661 Transcript_4262/m.10661 type:complete len:476 (-) Transcript_4262:2458-3885(-)|eukprot:CAMPEP_0113448106 /NCGR_PEP_ID=MMETSP0014_2-20120614/4592_1 /TAXON_ID=2857 /ORGANISM="Nitzschia sp." /LENGTH=475 /DNA_ID=CAMNT_0000339301 /DNA_START=1273 /DNA_END=2700 /DNA_ORIENTATION=+ /assembly_acc=CAM_ASM_000159